MKNNKCIHNQMCKQETKCIMQQMSGFLHNFEKTPFRKYFAGTKYWEMCVSASNNKKFSFKAHFITDTQKQFS
jgi:hypothetical protein